MITRMPSARAGLPLILALLGISIGESRLGAQTPPESAAPDSIDVTGVVVLPRLGGYAEDRWRLDQLLGRRSTAGFLVRSPAGLLPPRRSVEWRRPAWAPIAPEVVAVWNSGLPFSFNDGVLWAGRGLNVSAFVGLDVRLGPLALVLAPEVVYSENAPFQTIPYPDEREPQRDPFASPFHTPPGSADLPMRFGTEAVVRLDPGQSSLSLHTGPVALGVASENLWWGPGIRNGLLMSSHAPGIPHAFLRTTEPLRTRFGTLSGRWILGGLRESRYFDYEPDNDWRTISALALAFQPVIEPDLTVGLARAVVADHEPGENPAPALFDVFRNVGRPNSAANPDSLADADQILSLFGRWVFPTAGFEAYAEWARFEQPASLRDLLIAPNHSQGYTLGLQWANPLPSSIVRLQGELTYLEPSSTFRQRPVVSTYTSPAVEQGYTHRGQIIGASIGPGSSSQWLALDYIGDTMQIGAFGSRIRWEEEVHETVIPNPNILNHDVSMFGGMRGGIRVAGLHVAASFTTGIRFNYLFQNPLISLDEPEGVDVRFSSIRVEIGRVPL